MFFRISHKQFPILFKLILGLSSSLILLLFSIGYSYQISNHLYENNALIEHTDSLITQLDLLDLKLADCESSVKAYAMSNRYLFLRNYEKSYKATKHYLLSLEKLTENDKRQKGIIHQLRKLYKQRFKLLENAISIEKGEITDQKGLLNRTLQARQIRTGIQNAANELKSILRNSILLRKKESGQLLANNQLANQVAIILGGIFAGLVGLVVFRDVREREKTESQLRQLNHQKSQFFSIISHDLRGPTKNTTVLLEMMNDSRYVSSEEESQKIANLALESARQTHKLAEDLLTWSQMQMEQLTIVTSRFPVYEAVEKVNLSLQTTAALKGISLENNIPEHLFIQADSNMVETVIRNLVSNAIKYTPRGGKVKTAAHQYGPFIELSIEDSGVGMAEETLEKIFSFHTKHTTKGTAGEPGTGLGLAFCREFVERNGGEMSVKSQPGRGSTFNVRLPAPHFAEQE